MNALHHKKLYLQKQMQLSTPAANSQEIWKNVWALLQSKNYMDVLKLEQRRAALRAWRQVHRLGRRKRAHLFSWSRYPPKNLKSEENCAKRHDSFRLLWYPKYKNRL